MQLQFPLITCRGHSTVHGSTCGEIPFDITFAMLTRTQHPWDSVSVHQATDSRLGPLRLISRIIA